MKNILFGIPSLTKHCNEALILSILQDGRKHGYEIALQLEQKSQGFFTFNHGTLYPILHKLEKENLIKGRWKQEGPKRQRKYYTLTPKGRKYAEKQKNAWHNFFIRFFEVIGDIRE